MNIILFGPPGSGKSTYSDMLSSDLNMTHISMGGLLREISKEESDLGKNIKATLDKGDLVSDELVLEVFEKKINNIDGDVIIDGLPRTLNEAKKMEDVINVDAVISLKFPRDLLKKRLLERGRDDDTKETIKNRFSIYDNKSKKALEFYKDNSYKIIEVSFNDETPEEIVKFIEKKLKEENLM